MLHFSIINHHFIIPISTNDFMHFNDWMTINELIRNTYMFVKKEVNERFNYVPTLYCVFAAMAIMTVISVIITFFIIQSVLVNLKYRQR